MLTGADARPAARTGREAVRVLCAEPCGAQCTTTPGSPRRLDSSRVTLLSTEARFGDVCLYYLPVAVRHIVRLDHIAAIVATAPLSFHLVESTCARCG